MRPHGKSGRLQVAVFEKAQRDNVQYRMHRSASFIPGNRSESIRLRRPRDSNVSRNRLDVDRLARLATLTTIFNAGRANLLAQPMLFSTR